MSVSYPFLERTIGDYAMKVDLSKVFPVKTAIIGGSGLYELLANPDHLFVETPFGETPRIEVGEISGIKTAFLPRHSAPGSEEVGHTIPPYLVNYRANIYGLRMLGVERIFTSQACGSVNSAIRPGTLVILDQFLDATKSRPLTFYDGKTPITVWAEKPPIQKVVHIDVTDPYCPEIREALISACEEFKIPYFGAGTYICTEGSRFETAAEIRTFKIWGADVVGMTNVPECVLARELAMCYGSVAMSTNYAAGTGPEKITHEEVAQIFGQNVEKVRKVLSRAISDVGKTRKCPCKNALSGAVA
jgi:5'-methylthioadenosine phosphorylase